MPKEALLPVPLGAPQRRASYQTLLGVKVVVAAAGLLHVRRGASQQASVGLAQATGRVPRVRGAGGPVWRNTAEGQSPCGLCLEQLRFQFQLGGTAVHIQR